MSTEDDAPLEREPFVEPVWTTPEERRADRAEARLRSEVEAFGVRERSGPPVMGLVVIYAAVCLLVGLALAYTLPRIF